MSLILHIFACSPKSSRHPDCGEKNKHSEFLNDRRNEKLNERQKDAKNQNKEILGAGVRVGNMRVIRVRLMT